MKMRPTCLTGASRDASQSCAHLHILIPVHACIDARARVFPSCFPCVQGLYRCRRKGGLDFKSSREVVSIERGSVVCHTEADLFGALGMPPMAPEERAPFTSPFSKKAAFLAHHRAAAAKAARGEGVRDGIAGARAEAGAGAGAGAQEGACLSAELWDACVGDAEDDETELGGGAGAALAPSAVGTRPPPAATAPPDDLTDYDTE